MHVTIATVKITLKTKLLFLSEMNIELFYFITLKTGS